MTHHITLNNSAPNANVPYGPASLLQHISTPPKFAEPNSTPTVNWPRAKDIGSDSLKEEVIKIFEKLLV